MNQHTDWKTALADFENAKGAYQRLMADTGASAGDDGPVDLAHDAYFAAAIELLSQTPPDAAGLALQLRTAIDIGHVDYIGEDADDALTISRLITPRVTPIDGGRTVALVYRAALRLAGIETPALAAEPFDPQAWIDEFESVPGRVVSWEGVAFDEHAGGPMTATNPPSDWSASWHALRPWQRDLVREVAKERHDDGRQRQT
jgi:hypothetical protein